MLIHDLPEEGKRQLRTLIEAAGVNWEQIEGLTLDELQALIKPCMEDAEACADRNRRRLAIEEELNELAHPISAQYPGMKMWQVEYFLHGEDRARFQQLMRELDEMSRVPLAIRNRQPWYRAVEEELHRGPHRIGRCSVESVVQAVLKRDSTYPAGPLRQYVTYILETSAGMRPLAARQGCRTRSTTPTTKGLFYVSNAATNESG
jgi:hypothetical protein